MKILIIDDNIGITDMLSNYLTLKKHDCTVANSGRNGLSLIEVGKFDAIILDIAMPEFSGIDVMDQLNNDGKVEGNKIFVLTAVSLQQSEIDDLMKKGVHSVLMKPVNLQVLLQTIEGNN